MKNEPEFLEFDVKGTSSLKISLYYALKELWDALENDTKNWNTLPLTALIPLFKLADYAPLMKQVCKKALEKWPDELSPKTASPLLGKTIATLEHERRKNHFRAEPYLKKGNKVLYKKDTVVHALESHNHNGLWSSTASLKRAAGIKA